MTKRLVLLAVFAVGIAGCGNNNQAAITPMAVQTPAACLRLAHEARANHAELITDIHTALRATIAALKGWPLAVTWQISKLRSEAARITDTLHVINKTRENALAAKMLSDAGACENG